MRSRRRRPSWPSASARTRRSPACSTRGYRGTTRAACSDGSWPAAGSLLALELAGGYTAAARFVESCELATHAVSLGGVDTLVQHPASLTHRPVAPEARPGAGLVRVSVGLEHVDDLTVDLLQALDAALTPSTGSVPLAR